MCQVFPNYAIATSLSIEIFTVPASVRTGTSKCSGACSGLAFFTANTAALRAYWNEGGMLIPANSPPLNSNPLNCPNHARGHWCF